MFDCPAYHAGGEPDGTITVVRHQPDCQHLPAGPPFRTSPHAYTPSMAFTVVLPSPSGPMVLHPFSNEAKFEISPGGVLTITFPDGTAGRHFGVGQWIEVAVNTDPITK